MTKKKKKSYSLLKRILFAFFILVGILLTSIFYNAYQKVFQPNVVIHNSQSKLIYIPTGSNLSDVTNILYKNNYIVNRSSFEWIAEKKNYKNHINPGRYRLTNRMSNNDLINKLRSGKQELVKLVFNNIRYKEDFAARISKQIEVDSIYLLSLLNDKLFLSTYGFNEQNILSMFIPNTYEFYWNTSEKQFLQRMYSEYKKFWNENRINKAKKIDLTPIDISILASILEEETIKNDEKPIIAGVYINRLNKGIKLQADPTVKYAWKYFPIKRILLKHLKIDSPYNTYKYKGLPPGPINIPSVSSIEAVLNYQKHSYLYFCAKSDFSGYHSFAKTFSQHNANAKAYQQALNKRNIR